MNHDRARRMAATALLACAPLAFVLATRREARADDRSGVLETRHRTFETPQHFMFELRFGPYRPDIDSDPTLHGATPYGDTFGTPPHLMLGLELDYQAYRIPHLGTIGPGLSVAHVGISRQAGFVTPHTSPDGTVVTSSAESTSFEIFPMYAVAVFRADVFARDYHVPLVPYLKAGAGLAFWRGYNDAGTSSVGGIAAKGHTFGTHVAVGLAFNLNGLDQYTARNFDTAVGVNNTYLYWEYYASALNGIGQTDALRVGNSSWVMGLAFEF